MRRRTSSKKAEVEVEKEEKEHLSGAYIRSLVRHLSSSRNSPPVEEKLPTGAPEETMIQPPPPQIQPKKQVRRRFHTSRPFQERLLNMAEARREIVAALKYHRAKMRKSSSGHHHRDILPSPSSSSSSSSMVLPPPPSLPDFAWSSYYGTNNSVSSGKNFLMAIPKPPLGLNLNIDNFENLEQTPSLFSSSLSTTSSSATATTSASSSFSSSSCTTMSVPEASSEVRPVEPYHPTMDDREMEEIRSIAEQHGMEWNDKVNSAASAWWCWNHQGGDEVVIYGGKSEYVFGQGSDGIGSPPWFDDVHHHTTTATTTSKDYNFPCLDFGDIEGIDGEWLLLLSSFISVSVCSCQIVSVLLL